jgi:hypothetical protein
MFHVSDGLFFCKEANGAVSVVKHDADGKEIFHQLIDANSWCSVIASMSAGDEVDYRWYAAKAFYESKGQVEIKYQPTDEQLKATLENPTSDCQQRAHELQFGRGE